MTTLDADRTRATKVGRNRPHALALRTPCGHKLFGIISHDIAKYLILLVPQTGFEPVTPSLRIPSAFGQPMDLETAGNAYPMLTRELSATTSIRQDTVIS